jgi:hypothetical protein
LPIWGGQWLLGWAQSREGGWDSQM